MLITIVIASAGAAQVSIPDTVNRLRDNSRTEMSAAVRSRPGKDVYAFESAFLKAYGQSKPDPQQATPSARPLDTSQTIPLPPFQSSGDLVEESALQIVPLPPSSGNSPDNQQRDQVPNQDQFRILTEESSKPSADTVESPSPDTVETPPLIAPNEFRAESDPVLPVTEADRQIGLPAAPEEQGLSEFLLPNEVTGDWQEKSDPSAAATPASNRAGSQPVEPPGSRKPTFFVPNEDLDKFWWKKKLAEPLHPDNQTTQVDTDQLVYKALQNSPRIRAISQEPLIRDLQITEAESVFDPVSFLSSQFDDRVDPVGNTLTTGGAPFLLDHIFSSELGLRRKMVAGGELELSQLIGFQNSNSRFFVPQDQGTATLALNFSQPLLKGRGRYYNQSQILIAQATENVAWNAFQTQLQDELQNVVRGYWRLYYDRSIFLQKRRNVARGEKILSLLEGRQGLDSLPSQIARARSSVSSRKAELANAYRDVRNAETEIRRRIADSNWASNQHVEILPTETVQVRPFDMPLEQIVYTALDNRPEIKESLRQAKIAAIQYDVSQNELLPDLSLLLNSYVSALEGGTGIDVALSRQFTNTPGYSVGLNFEFPIGNRAARSRLAQRHVQKVKIQADLDENIQSVIAEAQVANRTLKAALETLDAAEESIVAARMDLLQQRNRWDAFALVNGDLAEGQTPTTILDQLLDAQDRLADAELVYSQAELALKLAEIELQRSMGTLLLFENVSASKTSGLCPAPQMNLDVMQGQSFDLPQPAYPEVQPVRPSDSKRPNP